MFRRNADGVDKVRAVATLGRPCRITKRGEVTVPCRFEDEAVQTVHYPILSLGNGEG